jgi:iron complex outermembrane receptor protein
LYNNVQYQTQRNQVSTTSGLYTTNQKVWGAMAEYTHQFESFSGTLQYSHRDVSGVNYGATRAPTQLFPNTQPGVIVSDIAELRFASTRQGPFQWVGGLFWMDSSVLGWNAAPSFAHTIPDPATGLTIPWGASTNGGYPNNTEVKSYSAYGQVSWTPPSLQKVRLSAGLRYNHDYNLYTGGYWASNVAIFAWGVQDMPAEIRSLFANVPDSAINASGEYVPDRSWDAVQWRLGIDYDLSDESMLYASVATGYKSGALVAGPTPEVKPEDLLAYELGSKNRFFDNRLQFNTSAWLYNYSNLEQSVNRPLGYQIVLPNGTVSSTTVSRASVGKVRLFGLSGDLNWLVSKADELGLSFTHIYSKILDGAEVSPTGVVTQILNEGERLGGSPEWTWIARYSHTFRFGSGATLDPGAKFRWEARQYNAATIPGNSVPVGGAVNLITGAINPTRRSPYQTAVPAQGVLDLSLRFVSASGRWSATAYVNNATDELNIQSLTYTDTPGTYNPTTRVFTPNATYGHNTATLGDPRTWGVAFEVRF